MAKKSKDLQHSKEQQFDELIQNNWYYNDVYTYLLKFENEYTNISLMDFIINCESATSNVLMALLNQSNNKDLTIKYIIEQRGYYETSIKPDYLTNYKLNDFELYLTKFIVAHCLVRYYKEDKKRTTFFNQMLAITERNKEILPQVHYQKYSIGLGWELSKYIIIEESPLYEEVTTTQPTPPQKEIKPIDSTLHQQFLIFHYLFKHLEISTNSIDKTQIARFIQFATQRQMEAKKIQNTKIYELVDNPFNGYKKEQGTTQTNLQKVRELFESLGLKEIAEIVSKDII